MMLIRPVAYLLIVYRGLESGTDYGRKSLCLSNKLSIVHEISFSQPQNHHASAAYLALHPQRFPYS